MLNIIKTNKAHFHSLRKRAIFFSAIISLLIALIAFFGYSNFKTFFDKSSLHLQQRDELLVRVSVIRGDLLDFYKELNNFLLKPENEIHQKSIFIKINETIRISDELQKHPWIIEYNREVTARELKEKLSLLEQEVKKLIQVRLDSTNQFPSLEVGARIMQPNRDKLNNALALAINEANIENTQIQNPKIYQTLISVRHLWTQVLSNFRLYLANRVGSFNKNALPVQENAIAVMFKELQVQLNTLQQYADAGKLGFETTEVLEQMRNSSNQWFKGFEEVKVIHHSDEWRRDAKIMKEVISPRFDSIVELLIRLENVASESSEHNMKLFESLGAAQNRMLWLIVFLGIFFTVIIVISLDKLIFKPIALVSKALKFEASGRKADHIPIVKTLETQDLINAFSEMSRQVHIRQTELEYRALHDALTSLPNRTLLLDHIEHDINTAKRESQNLSVLIIDLDDFKDVNDTLGHLAGDNLLIDVGGRINNALRDVDTVARIGGDEFSVLLPNTNEEQAIVTSQKILSALKKPMQIEGVGVSISASIGITVYPYHGDDVHTLLRHADIAMYVAKRHKLGFEVYDKEQDDHSISRLSMTKDFRDAIEHNKLTVDFQPIFDLASNKIIAIEALSRWNHPVHGIVSPEKFISLAEQTGLINELTYWVLNKSMALLSEWHKINKELSVAVNLSVFSFKDPDFLDEVRNAIRRHDYPSDRLKLEITESAMMENPLQAIEVLTELHAMGVKLSIDDFGTGFSSMAYLKQLPVDELKIDKSFIIGLDNDESNDAIVRSTIDLAHNLGLNVVAEGIESQTVNDLLQEYKCDMAQGFHLSRPIPADEFEEILKS